MKEIIRVYKQNRFAIEKYLLSSLNDKHIDHIQNRHITECFDIFRSLELVYKVSEDFVQSTPFYFRKRVDEKSEGMDRAYMFNKIQFMENGQYISQAYISSHNGDPSITVVKQLENGEYIVLDFSLLKLLEEMRFIENNRLMTRTSKTIYGFIGFGLVLFSLFLTGYAIYTFFLSVDDPRHMDLQVTFRSIISLTLGLAIFDLARTILEQEVFYKSYSIEAAEENRLLIRFLTSIIIALSIEALMVVFKIALIDYKEMGTALYLIAGVTGMIIALGIFSFLTKERREN